ncbi:hypothetical protein TIFTF001_020663 [Ficus carica]|uniref:Uncharacterized protein n=1 Tax=Ficus carica TaxID=3494 RepID=A0AA88AGI1_FICCA|nr:hypothetical protein TIFTF001_020663 [Ficus carica]
MENSTNISMRKLGPNNSSKTISTRTDFQTPEESSWTTYFEDFLLQNHNEYSTSSLMISSGFESSLISDAGSSANAKRFTDNEEIEKLSINRSCKRLSFKKRKTKEVNLLDDALEDTASSPVNSPKVFSLSQQGVKPKENNDVMKNMFEDKLLGSTSGQIDERSREEQSGYNINGKGGDCTELKKRGLCLVPLSMLVNYLG